MSKQIAILTHSQKNIECALKKYFEKLGVEVFVTDSQLKASSADLCIVDEYDGFLNTDILSESTFVRLHPSILPAFDCEKPIEKAFKEGVKLSGLTICYINNDASNGKIIAQYPIFIDFSTTIEDFKEELYRIKEKLAPFVADSILKDEIFDYGMLLKQSGCSNDCSNCKK